LNGVTSIGGYLWITGNSFPDLDALSALESVRYGMDISSTNLTSLDGLGGLRSIGEGLSITNNASLPTCEATTVRDQLTSFAGDVCIQGNLTDTCADVTNGCP
jgi:hypothetical protein